jgi:hypothetical protein
MSQSKEWARESQPDGERHDDATVASQHDLLSLRFRALLDERARLLEQLGQVDREIDRVRVEAADETRRVAEQLRESPGDRSCTVLVRDFVRGAAEPPADVDRDDFERCLGKVVLALRRRGDSLARTAVQVRYQARSGRVVAIELHVGDLDGTERQLYRRFDLGTAEQPG